MHAELTLGLGIVVNHKRVARLMREAGLVPDTVNDSEPWGRWYWKYAATPVAWSQSGDKYRDFAALAFYPNSRGDLSDVVGYQGYRFGLRDQQFVTILGYPAVGLDRTDFDGRRPWYCNGNELTGMGHRTYWLHCAMQWGSSGGPWLADLTLGAAGTSSATPGAATRTSSHGLTVVRWRRSDQRPQHGLHQVAGRHSTRMHDRTLGWRRGRRRQPSVLMLCI